MNIGIDIRSLMSPYKTGVEQYTDGLVRPLLQEHPEHTYVLFSNAGKKQVVPPAFPLNENVQQVHTTYPNKFLNFSTHFLRRPYLDRLMLKHAPKDIDRLDVLFTPNIGFHSVSPSCKQVLTIHDMSFALYPECLSFKRRLWHRVLNPKKQCEQADMILTPSENTRQDVIYEYGIPEEKVHVVYPGLSVDRRLLAVDSRQTTDDRLEVEKKYSLPEKFFLFLGTIEPRKNIRMLICAFEKSGLASQGFELIIAGPKGWKWKPILTGIEKTRGARYIGYVPEEEKTALYSLATVFVYSSLYEGFGFPVLEAMQAGTPVITSNRSSLPEIAGDAAYLVNPDRIDEMGEAMKRLAGSDVLRQLFIEKGKERAKEFRWEHTAKEFLEVVENAKNTDYEHRH